MGADGTVGWFPGWELSIELGEGARAGGDLLELLGMSTVGAFHRAMELGGARGQHEEAEAALAASGFGAGSELAAAVHRQRAQGKRQPWRGRDDEAEGERLSSVVRFQGA